MLEKEKQAIQLEPHFDLSWKHFLLLLLKLLVY